MDVALVGPVLTGVENHSLAALRDVAEDAGFTVAIVPFGGVRDFASALDAVLASCPRYCAISIQSTESAFPSLSFARTLKRRGFKGQIICGGHFATLNAEELHVEAGSCPNAADAEVQPGSDFSKCTPAGGCGMGIVMHFDANGMLVSFEGADPSLSSPPEMSDCLRTVLGQACYPSLACTTQRVTFASCWIA